MLGHIPKYESRAHSFSGKMYHSTIRRGLGKEMGRNQKRCMKTRHFLKAPGPQPCRMLGGRAGLPSVNLVAGLIHQFCSSQAVHTAGRNLQYEQLDYCSFLLMSTGCVPKSRKRDDLCPVATGVPRRHACLHTNRKLGRISRR